MSDALVPTGPAPVERADAVARVVLLVEAVAVAILLAVSGHRVLLPVVISLRGASGRANPVDLGGVDLGSAAVVVCLMAGLVRPGTLAALTAGRIGGAGGRWIRFTGPSLTWSITVVLVALLNGVAELGVLMALYALTSGLSLCELLQERIAVVRGHPLLALCFGSAIGVVPWGVVAAYQIGGGLAGDWPSTGIRILTIVVLAAATTDFVAGWRQRRRTPDGATPTSGEVGRIVLGVVTTNAFVVPAVLMVLAA